MDGVSKLLAALFVLICIVGGGFFWASNKAQRMVDSGFSRAAAQISKYGTLTRDGAKVSFFPPSVAIHGLRFQPHGSPSEIVLGHLLLDRVPPLEIWNVLQTPDATITTFRYQLIGTQIPVHAIASKKQSLFKNLGLQELVFSSGMEVNYSPTEETMDLKSLWIDGEALGKISISLKFGNVPNLNSGSVQGYSKGNPAAALQLLASLSALTLHGGKVSFQDQGLVARVRYAMYQETKTDIVQVVAMRTDAALHAFDRRKPSELEQSLAEAVVQFLKNPRNLSVEAQPTQPVPLLRLTAHDLNSADQVAKTLGLRVLVNAN